MLSKNDIENELLKGGINIYPLNSENIKENSVNLCTSKYAWTMADGDVYYNKITKQFQLTKPSGPNTLYNLKKGHACAIKPKDSRRTILLLPNSTTLIETKEVIAVGNNIGGTYHSKVGLVSQGFGHIGTMLGPNFSGHSLIAIHNITNELLTIDENDSFVSVVFHYLDTPIYRKNPTVSGHTDKFAELGIAIQKHEREILIEDWKTDIKGVREKMQQSKAYERLKVAKDKEKSNFIKLYASKNNIMRLIVILAILIGLIIGSFNIKNDFIKGISIQVFAVIIVSGLIKWIWQGMKKNDL